MSRTCLVAALAALAAILAVSTVRSSSPAVTEAILQEARPAGWLVIVGGGRRPPAMMDRLVARAGSDTARFVVIPNASSDPQEVGTDQAGQLMEHGAAEARVLFFEREGADDPANLEAVRSATGIFFSGGAQRRLADALIGTTLLEEIRRLYARGGTVAGTSAGAAVMSPLMITGDEAKVDPERDEPFARIVTRNVVIRDGFDLLPGTIIDQHFVRRKRLNRLISLVLERPDLVGIGIDESSAVEVRPGGRTFEVIGQGQVIVFDARQGQTGTAEELLAARGVTMHVLVPGDVFDLDAGVVVTPAPLTEPEPPARPAEPPGGSARPDHRDCLEAAVCSEGREPVTRP